MIKTKEDWWKTLKDNKHTLLAIATDNSPYFNLDIPVPAGTKDGLIKDGQTIRQFFDEALTNSDHEGMHGLMYRFWAALPDSPDIQSIPGFHILCDLCSEDWVFYEEE